MVISEDNVIKQFDTQQIRLDVLLMVVGYLANGKEVDYDDIEQKVCAKLAGDIPGAKASDPPRRTGVARRQIARDTLRQVRDQILSE